MNSQIDRLLFEAASSITSQEDRQAFLDFACQGDKALRDLIQELLELEGGAKEFFELEPTMENPAPVAGDEDSGIGARIGHYRLIDRLGAGGCGVVYLAEQQEPMKRKVALKIIRLGMDTESVIARFSMERESLALMDHPNIARVLDAGTTASGRPYFVMELVDGEKITDYCDRKRLGLSQRLELFIQVCEAIQHAHQKGVIHRDIKPSNVLVRDHDGRPVPKIIDFGIAKATSGGVEGEATFTRADQFLGTPAYMSPEQADGSGDIDTRSDIYSLGAMLCELLTGHPPFAHKDFKDRGVEQIRGMLREQETGVPSARLKAVGGEEMTSIAERRAVDPQRLPAELAGDLDWIVMKAIEKDRRRRYETANGLAMDVQRYLDEEPVLARPPSRRYLFSKLVRRNRVLFAASGVALFGLLAGLGVSTWLFFLEKDARQQQSRLRAEAEHARSMAEEARANEARMHQRAKAADVVTQAAVFVRYKEMDEADKLLSGLRADLIPASLEASNTLVAVANSNLAKGRWKEAADRFHALIHVLTSVDMKDTDANSREWLPAATAISEWGEPWQYEDFRRLAIRRFATSSNPIVAEHLLKVTLLQPADQETLKAIAPLAGVIEASLVGPNREKDDHLVAWRQFVLALLAYRQGDLETAAEWARLSSAATGNQPRTAASRVILAMIDLKQGRADDARQVLEKVHEEVRHWEAGPFQIESSYRISWSNWGVARILLREAEGMPGATEEKPPEEE
jgi:serine/threonine protein kinase